MPKLTEDEIASIEAARYETEEEAQTHADDLDNNDLEGDAFAEVVQQDDGGWAVKITLERKWKK